MKPLKFHFDIPIKVPEFGSEHSTSASNMMLMFIRVLDGLHVRLLNGGFHGHGGTPIDGGFIRENPT